MIRSLLTVKFQDLRVVQIAFQMVVDIYSPPAFNWTSGVNQIARLEGEKPTHIANQFVGRVNHICCRTALNRPAIYVELEINILLICQRFLVDPFTQNSRPVESLTKFPRPTLGAELSE